MDRAIIISARSIMTLTDVGVKQCRALSAACKPINDRVSIVRTSPLTRAIETATIGFKEALDNGKCHKELLALPLAKENFDFAFNTGLGPSKLKERADFSGWPVYLATVEEGWTKKDHHSPYFPVDSRLRARAGSLRAFVSQSIHPIGLRIKIGELTEAWRTACFDKIP